MKGSLSLLKKESYNGTEIIQQQFVQYFPKGLPTVSKLTVYWERGNIQIFQGLLEIGPKLIFISENDKR